MTIDISWLSAQFPNLRPLSELGSGGQRWTFACFHGTHGDSVLKIVKPGREARIDREMEALSRIPDCPNIPQLHEVGVIQSPLGPLIWILEERVHGETLSDVISKKTLSSSQFLRLAKDLLYIATCAEQAKVVHRDIKPENIIMDNDGKYWLLDFGITRILDLESRTRSDALMGPHSPGYGAPEQFRNIKDDIDGRADLFAIGIVLYEAILGVNPFIEGASDKAEILHRVETSPLPNLTINWDTEGKIGSFVNALTQKFPHRRPMNCAEAQAWLDQIMTELEGS